MLHKSQSPQPDREVCQLAANNTDKQQIHSNSFQHFKKDKFDTVHIGQYT